MDLSRVSQVYSLRWLGKSTKPRSRVDIHGASYLLAQIVEPAFLQNAVVRLGPVRALLGLELVALSHNVNNKQGFF